MDIIKEGRKVFFKNGISSFIDSTEFDGHWDGNTLDKIPLKKLDGAGQFLEPLHVIDGLHNVYILDAGAGDGVHYQYLSTNNGNVLPNYYSLDISNSALQIIKNRFKQTSLNLVQADVVDMPFKDESFDVCFSYGVIAYSCNPQKAFSELVRVTKSGGLVGLWVYPKKTGIGGAVFSLVRNICKLLGKQFTIFVANLIVPILGLLPTASKLTLSNASWKECREVVMVNISPEQLYFPKIEEVRDWFIQNSVEIVTEQSENPITFWGRKK